MRRSDRRGTGAGIPALAVSGCNGGGTGGAELFTTLFHDPAADAAPIAAIMFVQPVPAHFDVSISKIVGFGAVGADETGIVAAGRTGGHGPSGYLPQSVCITAAKECVR